MKIWKIIRKYKCKYCVWKDMCDNYSYLNNYNFHCGVYINKIFK